MVYLEAFSKVLPVILLFLLGAMVVFHFTIVREEAWLREAFGQPYIDYCHRTPRLGPDFSKWRDVETIEVRPELFLTTIRDGMVFLLAWPIFEGIEIAQQHGWLPLLLRLP